MKCTWRELQNKEEYNNLQDKQKNCPVMNNMAMATEEETQKGSKWNDNSHTNPGTKNKIHPQSERQN